MSIKEVLLGRRCHHHLRKCCLWLLSFHNTELGTVSPETLGSAKLKIFTLCPFTEKKFLIPSLETKDIDGFFFIFFPLFFLVSFTFFLTIIIILIICRCRLRPNDQTAFLWEAECRRGLSVMQAWSCERFLLDEFREQRPSGQWCLVGMRVKEQLSSSVSFAVQITQLLNTPGCSTILLMLNSVTSQK